MKILVTGFEPFGKETMNPSYEAVRLLPDTIAGAEIIKVQIPVVFRRGGEKLSALLKEYKPDIVLLVGQAGGRSAMSVERIAINCQDCSANFPDNEGNCPADELIFPDGPDGLFATLPIKAMVQVMNDGGVPAYVSNSAGTYVCNDLMYHLLYFLKKDHPEAKGGFIHVPYATIQNHPLSPSMTLEEISRGLKLSIEACVKHEKDIVLASGSTH